LLAKCLRATVAKATMRDGFAMLDDVTIVKL
jgi:hypothetical protein